MKNNFGLRDSDISEIVKVLQQYSEIEQAILFGSRAKGNYKPGSDVDIALKGENISHQTVNKLRFQLNEETLMPYEFDILNYHTIKGRALVEHIDRVGIVFYEKAPNPTIPKS